MESVLQQGLTRRCAHVIHIKMPARVLLLRKKIPYLIDINFGFAIIILS